MTEGARLSPRKGVLGLETEYAFVFTPEVGSSAPVQERIFEALSEVLKGQCTCQDAAYRKGGFFLANGGLLHYEAEADALHRGLLEMATPECSTVREALAHHRAQELVIARLLPGIRERLTKSSFAGTLVIGKASSDYQGHTFGTHENYLVEDRPGPVRLAALGLWIVVFQLVRLPLTLLYTGLTVLALVLFGLVFATTMAVALGQAIRRRPTGDEAVEPAMVRWLDRAIKGLVTVAGRLQILEHRYLLPPASRLVSPLLFHRFRDELVTFLVTRLVFTGPGWLRTDRPGEGARFVLSPKASAIGEVAQVYCDPARKPIVDLKNLFRGLFTLLSPRKRLHIAFSDTNMSEYATWLKLATTHLVVRMLEAGYLPAGCRLDDPLSALDQVDQDLTFQERLAIRGAPARTALEIQAAFLDTARRYACDREPDDPQVERTLGEWAQVLDLLAHDRTALADRLDWVAKHDLMDEAVEPVGWDAVSRALGPIRWLEEHNIGLGRVVDQPDQVGGFLQKRLGADFAALAERMRVADLAWDSLPAVYRMFYQLKKIDLRYHEIGEEGGYYLQMEREGLFRRELSAREIERAAEHPPEQTRAAARGHYILEANRLKLPALVGWDELIVPSRFAIISMPDPLCPTPPVALAGFESESFVRTALRLVWFIPRLVSRGA